MCLSCLLVAPFSLASVRLALGLTSLASVIITYAPHFIKIENGFFLANPLTSMLIFLTLVISFLVTMIQSVEPVASPGFLKAAVLGLLFTLGLVFQSSSLIVFYFRFEATLWPMLLIVLGWGYQPERISAGRGIVMYTVLASLPLLIAALSFGAANASETLLLAPWSPAGPSQWTFATAAIIVLGFLVKFPIIFLHAWLPKAHVEAPVGGSMLLAAVLLKLGGVGFIFLSPLLNFGAWGGLIQALSLWGGILASVLCVAQTDLKLLIAYSSVGHMAFAIRLVSFCSSHAFICAALIMLAHGISSSVLFGGAYLYYVRASTRNLVLYKRFLSSIPLMAMLWFMACCINIAAPPTINFFAEVSSCLDLIISNSLAALPLGVIIFLAGAYSLVAYLGPNHGRRSQLTTTGRAESPRELLFMVTHSILAIALTFLFL